MTQYFEVESAKNHTTKATKVQCFFILKLQTKTTPTVTKSSRWTGHRNTPASLRLTAENGGDGAENRVDLIMTRGVIWNTHTTIKPHLYSRLTTHTHKQIQWFTHIHSSSPLYIFFLSLSPTHICTHWHTSTHIPHISLLWPDSRNRVRVQFGNGVSPTWQCQVIQRGRLYVYVSQCVYLCGWRLIWV